MNRKRRSSGPSSSRPRSAPITSPSSPSSYYGAIVKTIKGPAIFLAQFAGGGPHLQNFNDMCKWAAGYGYVGVQLPSWDGRVMDLAKAAESKTYCDELKGVAAKHNIEITELAAHLQGQLVAVHPAYDLQF